MHYNIFNCKLHKLVILLFTILMFSLSGCGDGKSSGGGSNIQKSNIEKQKKSNDKDKIGSNNKDKNSKKSQIKKRSSSNSEAQNKQSAPAAVSESTNLKSANKSKKSVRFAEENNKIYNHELKKQGTNAPDLTKKPTKPILKKSKKPINFKLDKSNKDDCELLPPQKYVKGTRVKNIKDDEEEDIGDIDRKMQNGKITEKQKNEEINEVKKYYSENRNYLNALINNAPSSVNGLSENKLDDIHRKIKNPNDDDTLSRRAINSDLRKFFRNYSSERLKNMKMEELSNERVQTYVKSTKNCDELTSRRKFIKRKTKELAGKEQLKKYVKDSVKDGKTLQDIVNNHPAVEYIVPKQQKSIIYKEYIFNSFLNAVEIEDIKNIKKKLNKKEELSKEYLQNYIKQEAEKRQIIKYFTDSIKGKKSLKDIVNNHPDIEDIESEELKYKICTTYIDNYLLKGVKKPEDIDKISRGLRQKPELSARDLQQYITKIKKELEKKLK